ncbi:MAG TPA: MlaD family protein [Candidatus Dormibacteraeota bacterium]|nr:MlaD family protein [Candidatus Dormibacteraeota bacterium]
MRLSASQTKLAAVAAAVVVVLGAYVAVTRLPSPHSLTIHYPTASGLVPGSDVFEAGAKVGSVSDIRPDSGDGALVTVGIDDANWPLHQGVTAAIRPKSLLGEKYVDLHDGTGAGYDSSRTLVAAADSTPVELDQFLNTLDPQSRESVKVLINDLGAGVAGRGADLNAAIAAAKQDLDHLAVTGQTLDNRDPDLDRILLGLDSVLQKLTTNDQLTQLSQLITTSQTTLDALEAERTSFSRQFVDAQRALTELDTVLSPTVAVLRDTLQTAPELLTNLRNESGVLAQLGQPILSGNTLDVLVSGLTHAPTTLGGAVEKGLTDPRYAGGAGITRICIIAPSAGALTATSCEGNGFHPPAGSITNAATAAWSGSSGDSSGGAVDLQRLVGFVGT